MFLRSTVALLFGLFVASSLVPSGALGQTAAPARGQLTRPPRLTHFVEAPYPESERERGSAASVTLAIVIGADGRVEDAAVVESGGEAFDAAALVAVRAFVFEPAEIDGVPARIRIVYRYEFAAYVPPRPVTPVATTAVFTGVLRDAETGSPVAEATVTLDEANSVTTDAEGRFRFDGVEPGAHRVTIRGSRLPFVQTEETLAAGETLETTYDVALIPLNADGTRDSDMEIIVFAPRLTRQAVVTEVSADEARRVPGTGGEVVQVVNNLPGVGRSAVGSGAFVVWGAAPEDTGVYVDGVRVPRLYHDGGLRAVTGSEFVRSVQLVPGGYGSAYGRGLGGLVMVDTHRADADDEQHATASFDIYDAAASYRGRLSDRVSLSLAGRASYVAPLLSAVASSDIEDFFPLPHYYDAQARVGLRLRRDEWMDLTTLVSGDRIRRTVVSPDPARSTIEEREQSFQRVYARYGHDVDSNTTVSAVLFGGADHRALSSAFGNLATSLVTDSAVFGLRASYRSRVAEWLTIEGGLDSELTRTDVARRGSIAAPPREGDIRVFGQPPPDQVGSDAYSVTYVNLAPYVAADVSALDDRLTASVGLRLDPYARSASRVNPSNGATPAQGLFAQDLRAEPRIQIRYAPSDRGHIQAAFGLYGQSPQAADLSAVFGNPRLDVARAQHSVLGGSVKLTETLTAEVTSFYTHTDGLAMRNTASSPSLSQALLSSGTGRAYGVQTLLRLAPTRGFFGWISYTLMRADRRDAPGLGWRPFDYDQRHVLTALAGYRAGHGFEFGARARVATGLPRTAVNGAYYDARRDLYQPLFSEHNGIRIPTFVQLDVRIAKSFSLHDTQLDVFLEVQNVTNRKNVEELIYDADYTVRGAIRGLPILPVLGVRWSL